MKTRFDQLIKETIGQLDEANPNDDPSLGGVPSNAPTTTGDVPVTDPTAMPPAEPPTKLTTEGKRFLVDLALKALLFDPSQLTEQDKSLFENEVTTENAEEILERIRDIIGPTDVTSSADLNQ